MPKYRITYYRQYDVKEDCENHALGISDQTFTDDIRKTLSELGNNKIIHLFKFKIEKTKKNGVLKRKIEESKE